MSVLEISPLPGVAGLRLDGELDLATAPLLKEALVDLGSERDVHLDLALLTFLDSSGVHAIVALAHVSRRQSFGSARQSVDCGQEMPRDHGDRQASGGGDTAGGRRSRLLPRAAVTSSPPSRHYGGTLSEARKTRVAVTNLATAAAPGHLGQSSLDRRSPTIATATS